MKEKDAIKGFLRKEGALGLIIWLHPRAGKLFGELESDLNVSQTTLSRRLDDAMELNLITRTWQSADHGNAKRYRLTRFGKLLLLSLESSELDERYREYHRAQREIEEKINSLDHSLNREMTRSSNLPYDEYNREGGYNDRIPDFELDEYFD